MAELYVYFMSSSNDPQFHNSGLKKTLSNLRGINNALCVFEDNGLKNNHPLSIPLPSTDPVKFYRQDYHKYVPDFPRRCVLALGWHTNKFFPLCLLLIVFRDSFIQVVSCILVHPILVDSIYHIVGAKEVDVWEVSLFHLKVSIAGLDVWEWRRLLRG